MVNQAYQSIEDVTSDRSRAAQNVRAAYAPQRPWGQLMDRGALARPGSVSDGLQRLKRNLSYFRTNYAIVLLVIIGLSLLWHPISLIVLAVLLAAWMYLYFGRSEPLTIFGRPVGEKVVLGFLSIVTIVALFFTKAIGPLIGGLIVGFLIMAFHGAFRRTDDLFLDEQENRASGP